MRDPADREHFEIVVVGGGQAVYHLARRRARFIILDAGTRIGVSWRNGWESLRLFTHARIDALRSDLLGRVPRQNDRTGRLQP
jgi:putative flavoprotein involved in K+ transport